MDKTENIVASFKNAKILCIGDLMLDRFVKGEVERISPEAPVPVFRWVGEKEVLGGAGNVAANLRALGVGVKLIGRIGRDQEGEKLKGMFSSLGIETRLVVSDRIPTIVKTRFISKNNHILRMDQELVEELCGDEESIAIRETENALKEADLVIVSDYAKGFLSKTLLAKIMAMSAAAGKKVFVDPKGQGWKKYSGATLVKPNRKELKEETAANLSADDPKLIENTLEAARAMLKTTLIKEAVVTLSEKGMVYIPLEGESLYLPTEGREVYDVSGAGDTTIAVLAAASAVGASMKDAMNLANIAAGVVVGKLGTSTVTPQELLMALKRKLDPMPFARKIYSLEALKQEVVAWQAKGEKVGFTNGCFDCLHSGHLFSLYQAKEHCDRLVVAVNSDSSVRRLKGPTRPIQDEKTRSLVLAGLEAVDAVVVFEEDTALGVVEALRPDVIAKEGYAIENWPEAQVVAAYGGQAITLKRLEGYSTSNMVKKIAQA